LKSRPDTGAADRAHPRKFCFHCDSDLAQFAALRAGVRIGGCQQNIARRFKELVPVLAETIRFELEVWIAMHEDMRSTGRVRMLFDHLLASLSAFVRGVDVD
jgi:DNA-binding transcriptional LysR family regulator